MSNGDDVLDNWDEIDEAELDSKLNKLKEGKRLQDQQNQLLFDKNTVLEENQKVKLNEKLLFPAETTSSYYHQQFQKDQLFEKQSSSPLDDMSSFQNNVPLMMVLHKPDDEYQSANYMQPTKSQTVKILRRPTQSNDGRGNGMRPKQPIKTLQQREQEYAEARLRILGAAKNPEDDAETSSNAPQTPKVQSKTLPESPNNNFTSFNSLPTAASQPQHQQQSPVLMSGSGGSTYSRTPVSSPMISGNSVSSSEGEGLHFSGQIFTPSSASASSFRSDQDAVVRMPRGPDGTSGFQMRR